MSLKRSASSSAQSQMKKTRSQGQSLMIRVPRPLKPNTVIVKRSVRYTFDLNTDNPAGFGFSPTYLWVSGTSTTAIDGASDLTSMFEECRIAKVQCILLPGTNVHEIATDSAVTGARSIPWLYTGVSYTAAGASTMPSILQNDQLRVDLADHKIVRTIYPRMTSTSSSGIALPKNTYVATGTDIPFFGLLTYMDVYASLPYNVFSWTFIIHYECKNSK